MDAGDFIYILIAIALAILNAFAKSNKKKAAEQKRQAEATKNVYEEQLAKKLQELLGADMEVEANDEQYSSGSKHEESQYAFNSNAGSESRTTVKGLEEMDEPLDKVISEEDLYSIPERKPLDVSAPIEYAPIDIAESKVEGPIGDYSYQDSFNESMLQVEMEPTEDQTSEGDSEESHKEPILADFDPAKAVVYSEIIKPKYF